MLAVSVHQVTTVLKGQNTSCLHHVLWVPIVLMEYSHFVLTEQLETLSMARQSTTVRRVQLVHLAEAVLQRQQLVEWSTTVLQVFQHPVFHVLQVRLVDTKLGRLIPTSVWYVHQATIVLKGQRSQSLYLPATTTRYRVSTHSMAYSSVLLNFIVQTKE